LSVVGAVATSTNTVLVEVTAPALAMSPVGAGDALNPRTWSVMRGDNGFSFTILAVRDAGDALVFEVRTLEQLGGWLISHTVACPAMLDASRAPIQPPTSAKFLGVEAFVKPYDEAGVVDFDIANPPAPLSGIPATIPTTAAGDYATVAGADLAEKLIIRAITTSVGGFFFLPDYGFGLGTKSVVTPSNLGRLKADIVRTVEAIPMIDAANAQVGFDNATGVLTVTVFASLQNTGQTIQVVRRFSPRNP
jgi:hypothetical protein